MSLTPVQPSFADLLKGVDLSQSLLPNDAIPAASEPAGEPMDVAAPPKLPETLTDFVGSQTQEDQEYVVVEQGGSYYLVRKSQSLAENEKGVALKDQNGQLYLNSNLRAGDEPRDAFSAFIQMITLMINGQSVQGIKLDDAATEYVQEQVRKGEMSVLHSEHRQGDTGNLSASRTYYYDENGQLIPGRSEARPADFFDATRVMQIDAMEQQQTGLTVTSAADVEYARETPAIKRTRQPDEQDRKYVAVKNRQTGQVYYALVASEEEKAASVDHSGSGIEHQIVNVELDGNKLALKALRTPPGTGEYLTVQAENGQTAYLELIQADRAADRALQTSEVTPLQLNEYDQRSHEGELLLSRERKKIQTGEAIEGPATPSGMPSDGIPAAAEYEYRFVPVMPEAFNAESLAMFEQGNTRREGAFGRALEGVRRPSYTEQIADDPAMKALMEEKGSSLFNRKIQEDKWQAHDPDAVIDATQQKLTLPEGTKRVTIDYRTGTISASIGENSGNVYQWNLADVGKIDFSNVTYSVGVQFKGQTQGRQLPAFTGLENLEHARVSGLKTQYGQQLSPGYNMPMLDGDVAGVMGDAFGEAAEKNDKMAERRQQREAEREMLAEMRHNNRFKREAMRYRIQSDVMDYRMQNEGRAIGERVVHNRAARVERAGQREAMFDYWQMAAGTVARNNAYGLPPGFGLQGFGGGAGGQFGQQGGYGQQQQPFGAGLGSPQPFSGFGQQQGAHNLPPQVVQILQQQQQQIASLQSQLAAIGGAPNQPGAGSPVSYEVALNSSPGNGQVRRT